MSLGQKYLAANTESFKRVESEPPGVSRLPEAVHELCIEVPLQARQSYQDHVLLFRRQLIPENIMTSPGQGENSLALFFGKKLMVWLKNAIFVLYLNFLRRWIYLFF